MTDDQHHEAVAHGLQHGESRAAGHADEQTVRWAPIPAPKQEQRGEQ